MQAFYLEQEEWKKTEHLFEAFSFGKKLEQKREEAYIVAVIGAGGKTSSIYRLAAEGVKRGKRVLIMTTTHMLCPRRFGVFGEELEQVEEVLQENSVAIVGRRVSETKISFVSNQFYKRLRKKADLILIEADGCRHHPLKVPASYEPVIPEKVDEILCLAGLSSLGKRAEEVCFRFERAVQIRAAYLLNQIKNKQDNWISQEEKEWMIQKEDIKNLMRMGYFIPMREQNQGIEVSLVLTQADKDDLRKIAREIFEELEEKGVILSELPVLSQYEAI